MQQTTKTRRLLRPRNLLIIIGVAVITLLILELAGVTHVIHRESRQIQQSGSAYTKGESAEITETDSQKTSQTTSPNTDDTQNDKGSNGSGANQTNLSDPTGNFVSNHRPNLSGSPAPNTVTSVCTTTPGATCTIQFVQSDKTLKLEQRTTDKGGSAYWDWKIQDIGLTSGVWKVTAVATLGAQTKTTTDAVDMVVSE